MRILHVVHKPRHSGAEILVAELAKLHAERGHECQVVAQHPSSPDFAPIVEEQARAGVAWCAPHRGLSRAQQLLFLRQMSKRFRAHVTFAHSEIPAAYARLAGLPNVVPVLHSQENYATGRLKYFESILQHRARAVIAVSEIAAKSYSATFKVPRVRWIPNGVSLGKFSSNLQEKYRIRAALGLSRDARVLLQVGRIHPIKGQHISIQALAGPTSTERGTQLVFAGLAEDPVYLERIRGLSDELAVGDRIFFLGPRNDVNNLLQAADVFLMPSTTEAQGIALVEALAAGLPIVASDIPGFRFSRDLPGVWLTDVSDPIAFDTAIAEAASGPSRFHRDMRQYSIEQTAEAYVELAQVCADR